MIERRGNVQKTCSFNRTSFELSCCSPRRSIMHVGAFLRANCTAVHVWHSIKFISLFMPGSAISGGMTRDHRAKCVKTAT